MKNLIKKWLGITQLENENKRLQKVIKDYLKVAIDVHSHPKNAPSWAVVYLNGKQESLKFYGADDRTIEEIKRFLSQFERHNRIIDAPLCTRKFFEDVL